MGGLEVVNKLLTASILNNTNTLLVHLLRFLQLIPVRDVYLLMAVRSLAIEVASVLHVAATAATHHLACRRPALTPSTSVACRGAVATFESASSCQRHRPGPSAGLGRSTGELFSGLVHGQLWLCDDGTSFAALETGAAVTPRKYRLPRRFFRSVTEKGKKRNRRRRRRRRRRAPQGALGHRRRAF